MTTRGSIQIERHEYAENSWLIHHFTGNLLVGTDDLEEAQVQLDGILAPRRQWPSFFSGLTLGLTAGVILAAGIYALLQVVYG
ncbi:hypothetical protein SEA_BRUHMOMENT_11 [Arthrobacter phage BruhMoment]|nr:hypothetical protein SEA_BRUHMOMENT_11 [Arthrobacter phage BruhMoment]